MKKEFKDASEAIELANKAFDTAMSVAKHESTVSELNENFKSHKHDIYQRIDKQSKKIESMPDRNEIALLFKEEGEKIATALKAEITITSARVTSLETDRSKVKGALWGIWTAIISIGSILAYLGIKLTTKG